MGFDFALNNSEKENQKFGFFLGKNRLHRLPKPSKNQFLTQKAKSLIWKGDVGRGDFFTNFSGAKNGSFFWKKKKGKGRWLWPFVEKTFQKN